MTDAKKKFLEELRRKIIEYEIKILKEDLIYAYRSGDYRSYSKSYDKITKLNNMLDKLNRNSQDDNSNISYINLNKANLDISENEKKIINIVMESPPLSNEENMEVERIMGEITYQNNKNIRNLR